VKSEFIEISDELFLKVGNMITEKYGIKMPAEKKIMFQARLQRRLHELDIDSFDEYAERLFSDSNESSEFNLLADFISTNKTEFFREKEHFSFLSEHVLPEFFHENTFQRLRELNLWSAGCSSGQEAYSIGIQFEEFMRKRGIRFDYSILATDISGKMLRSAKEAVYPMLQVDEIPIELKHRYFLKSKNSKDAKVKVVKAVREKVRVGYLNLMDSLYPFDAQFDVVFLRNTLIYFDQKIQLKVLTKVLGSLKTGGYLFIGHSESLINLQLPIKSIAPSVYIKINTKGL
jgi:chemotaxis protein methyltransferase CheR